MTQATGPSDPHQADYERQQAAAEAVRQPLSPAVHDGLAIASLVLSLVWLGGLGSLLAVIFGHMSHNEAKRANRQASGLATAGLVLGYKGLVAIAIVIIAVIVAATNKPDPTQQWIDCLNRQLSNPNLVCTPPPGP